MDSVIRAVMTFFFLMLVFRMSGKRSLAQITTFDAVLLLIISEATQEALTDGDQSLTNSFLVVLTLVALNMLMQQLSTHWPAFDKVANSTPLMLIEDGYIHQDRLARTRITEDDILEEGRVRFGVERLDQLKYAVLERNGGISIIPQAVRWASSNGAQPDQANDENARGNGVQQPGAQTQA